LAQTVESLKSPRRFYSGVDVAPTAEGFAVRLDGRVARTPAGRVLAAPTRALANIIAGEWKAQAEVIALASMRVTSLAYAAIDEAPEGRQGMVDEIVAFAGNDLICYFASAPASLLERQQSSWNPLIDWADAELSLEFTAVSGVIHKDQPAATVRAIESMARDLDNFRLAGLFHAARLFGSTILGLALMRARLSAATAAAAAQLDEMFQADQWGVDEGAGARRRAVAVEAAMLQDWFEALGQP
jgi:chaperone required for assembly of F1-ATPase